VDLLGSTILVERGGLQRLSALLPRSTGTALIVDRAIPQTHMPTVTFTVPSGEGAKSLQEAIKIWEGLEEAQLDRGCCIIAQGGGALLDMAGFVASCYLRGVSLVLIPTSLLAMVDASIGGKNGVNGLNGKNRIGTTYLPALTLIDPCLLDTLPERQWSSGWAEVIKCAAIQGEASIGWLEEHLPLLQQRDPSTVDQAIQAAISTKIEKVAGDLHDRTGLRAQLNFGHTFGHALETACQGQLTHGEAVSIGMVCAAQLSIDLGLVQPTFKHRLEKLCRALCLPTAMPYGTDLQQLVALMARDKKSIAGQITCLVAHGWGQIRRQPIEPSQIRAVLYTNQISQ